MIIYAGSPDTTHFLRYQIREHFVRYSFFLILIFSGLVLANLSLAMEKAGTSDREKCKIEDGQAVSGDYKLPTWLPGDYVTFGPSASIQAARYDFASKKAAIATGAGAGISIRFYNNVQIKGEAEPLEFTNIHPDCRRTTFDGGRGKDPEKPKIVGPAISITPIIYYSMTESSPELSVQPAIQLGFLEELINVGVGFNLTGPQKGHVFLLLSLGYGFRLDK
jgi:hypothetical protein